MDKETATFWISIVGASAWLAPYFYEKFKKAKLVGKVISIITVDDMTTTDNNTGGVVGKGIFYLYKLSVSSIGDSFYPKDLLINLKYSDGSNYKGRIIVPRNINVNHEGSPHKVSPPRELLYPNVCVFQKGSAQHVYIPFVVDRATKGEVDEIIFVFEDFKGLKSKIKIDFSTVDKNQLMFEEILEAQ